MKKNLLSLFFTLLMSLGASAQVMVCGDYLEESGPVNSPYIKSGSVTWDSTRSTLTLDNAVIEYSSNNPQDGIRPIRVTGDATIVVQGDSKLSTNGNVAVALDSYNSKNVTIKGNGSLSTSSSWIDIFLVVAHLTIQDITLNTVKGIANNAEGNGVGLAFDNVQATIQGEVARIGDGITFTNCAITYPEDAYIGEITYGYIIYYGNHQLPDKIIISRIGSGIKGDVNNDGEVNIADVNAVINVILGRGSNTSADVNGDGEINIADVNAIISIILGGGSSQDGLEYVDLGLPSGTLWATCNVGANAPEQYGDYFAWGETIPKDVFSWENYKWCNGTPTTQTKYCTDNVYGYEGFTDGKVELESADDAASAHFHGGHMPSYEQIVELYEKCTLQLTQRNGVNGLLVMGPNGNTLFLPAAGYRAGDKQYSVGSAGHYWSNTLYSRLPYRACRMYFNTSNFLDTGGSERYYGFTVRAVRESHN